MAINRVIRYVLAASSPAVEAAMFEYATYIRAELPDCHWSMFRDPATAGTYIALIRCTTSDGDTRLRTCAGTTAFEATLAPYLASPPDDTQCDLVTSTDLAPRRREPAGRRRPPNRRPR